MNGRSRARAGKLPFLAVGALLAAAAGASAADPGQAALAAFMGADFSQALALSRPEARADGFAAPFVLGRLYELGAGVPKDQGEADRWFARAFARVQPAARTGDPEAQFVLGAMYERGDGVPRDDVLALAWFRRAADQSFALAEESLGTLYNRGTGVPQDFGRALFWYRRAAATGSPRAKYDLGAMYISGGGVPADAARGLRLVQESAEQGVATAQYVLGLANEYGWYGSRRDRREAAYWYRQAADAAVEPHALMASLAPSALWYEAAAETERARTPPPTDAGEIVDAAPRSDVDEPPYRLPEEPDDYALVVGVEKYSSDLPDARFARRDAQAVRDQLVAMGYPPRNIAFLTDSQASLGAVKKNVESWLPDRVDANSTVFVYFAGHGSPDPATGLAYLVPWDGDPQYLADTAYPMSRLYRRLDALKAKRVFLALDSCFSGRSGRSVMAKGERPLVTKVDLGASLSGKVV
ncbi:MAG TPA: caspase family protein, partial [Elusimicrobiota bacterium]|nr:caspase family protein [Elusimicrobiota bacterium]